MVLLMVMRGALVQVPPLIDFADFWFADVRNFMPRNAFTGGEFVSKVARVERNDDGLAKKWSGPSRIRSGLDPSEDPGISFVGDPGMVDPSHKEETDVNWIIDRFHKTGVLPGVDVGSVFADIADAPTYHDAMNIVARANEQFEALDARVRKRFSNDPAEFLAFCSDESNRPEMEKLGLIAPTPLSKGDRGPGEPAKGLKESGAIPKESNRKPPAGAKDSGDHAD